MVYDYRVVGDNCVIQQTSGLICLQFPQIINTLVLQYLVQTYRFYKITTYTRHSVIAEKKTFVHVHVILFSKRIKSKMLYMDLPKHTLHTCGSSQNEKFS